jgi:hypothetical protein
MSLATQRTAIKTILEGVSGIGLVHEYERWANDWKKFLELYKTANKKINGWTITRKRTAERWSTGAEYERVNEFLIRGIFGLKDEDETELTFQSLIEDICDAFRSNHTLNGTCETTDPDFGSLANQSGIQVELVEPRMIGSVLCHYCELALGAQTFEKI